MPIVRYRLFSLFIINLLLFLFSDSFLSPFISIFSFSRFLIVRYPFFSSPSFVFLSLLILSIPFSSFLIAYHRLFSPFISVFPILSYFHLSPSFVFLSPFILFLPFSSFLTSIITFSYFFSSFLLLSLLPSILYLHLSPPFVSLSLLILFRPFSSFRIGNCHNFSLPHPSLSPRFPSPGYGERAIDR